MLGNSGAQELVRINEQKEAEKRAKAREGLRRGIGKALAVVRVARGKGGPAQPAAPGVAEPAPPSAGPDPADRQPTEPVKQPFRPAGYGKQDPKGKGKGNGKGKKG